VAVSSNTLAEGASRQTAAVEEVLSAANDLDQATEEYTKEMEQVKNIVEETAVVGVDAFNQLKEARKTFKEVLETSEKTSSIVTTIENIAFQTRLLALNASVEAARAGEAGAGFSVVSNDIRNLGGRSSEAARNSQEMIDKTIQVVTSGGDDLRHTLKMFVEYGTVAFKITDVTKEAFKVAAEQRKGVVSINATMQRIREIAEENAHTAERCTEVAQVMETHAAALKNFIRELGSVVGHGVERSR